MNVDRWDIVGMARHTGKATLSLDSIIGWTSRKRLDGPNGSRILTMYLFCLRISAKSMHVLLDIFTFFDDHQYALYGDMMMSFAKFVKAVSDRVEL